MGNEGSQPERGSRQDDFNSSSSTSKALGNGDREFENVMLPPMVLIIDAILWRAESLIQAIPREPNSGRSDELTKSTSGLSFSTASNSGSATRIWCRASLDGREIVPPNGQPLSFPLPHGRYVGGPMKVIPENPASVLTLRFNIESGASSEINIPLSKLIRYGAPLYTTLWLGLPLDGGSNSFELALAEAIDRAQDAEVPKVVLTIFRPARNQDFQGMAFDPQPDVHGALVEDIDTCTGPNKKGVSATHQIKGLTRALKKMSQTTHALQEALFKGDHNHGNLAKTLQETIGSLTTLSPKPQVGDSSPSAGAAEAQARAQQLQAELDETRRENTKLQVEIAGLQERAKFSEEHWKQLLDSARTEVEALRNTDAYRSQELDRANQELGELNGLRAKQEEHQEEIEKASTQLEELTNLRSQVQTQRGQQLYLQRELTLASEELQSLRALEGQRKALSQDHAQVQDELVRAQVTQDGLKKELQDAREELKVLPGLQKQVQYLEAELKLARDKAESLSKEHGDNQQELARARATSEAVTVEKDSTERRLEEQLSRASAELEALRSRDMERPVREEEYARLRVELDSLRQEKVQWREDLDAECARWNNELEALRIANDKQIQLQDELTAKSVELEVLRRQQKQEQSVQDQIVQKTQEIEVRNKVEDAVLQETLSKLKAAAPKGLKDLRDECTALRAKDKERVQLKEELETMKVECVKRSDEVRDLREAERKTELRLQESSEELERKKGELLNMRAEREVLRTGEVLRQELVDENLSMREELDKLKKKDSTSRKDLQDQLERAMTELNVLRATKSGSEADAWAKQKTAADPDAVLTV